MDLSRTNALLMASGGRVFSISDFAKHTEIMTRKPRSPMKRLGVIDYAMLVIER
jgi:hypothetical protein